MDSFSIGALARDAGVSVQTLRHYDRIGLLRPATRTAAGYRRYSAADRARLDTIRTLRTLDFPLATIASLLGGATTLGEAAALQLRALEHQAAVIRRRMAVLRVFLRSRAALGHRRLKQIETLARIERTEQAEFLTAELGRRMGRNTPPALRDTLLQLARIELPDSATEVQLDAWLELAVLVADPAFLAHYADRAQPEIVPERRVSAGRVYADAVAAKEARVTPSSPKAKAIARRWIRGTATQAGRADYRRFAEEMIDQIDSGRHAPEQRFWELLAVLRPDIARAPQLVAGEWLIAATRAWLASG